ncbi:sigma-E factor negative regulatory protein [Pseudomaricurvus alcaniphilus]|uniref:sigma-E factor negative regulatory protein n=1 Tax=Pseudomaricurvus alcaniphilus TaxID=1166482 RepID=UPI001FB7BFCE|nr:sigma-E factor negative regulatory protein [Pseudomaricurvus alcaniphilus]
MALNSEQNVKVTPAAKSLATAKIDTARDGSNAADGLSEHMRESLSALVDGQASELEIHRLLKAGKYQSEIDNTWSRYQLVSSTLRNNLASGPLVDLSSAIREAIEHEDIHSHSRVGWRSNFLKVGIAASVAAVMVFTTQMVGLQSGITGPGQGGDGPTVATVNTTDPSPAAIRQAVSLPAGFQAPTINARVVSSQPGLSARESQPRYYPVVTKAQSVRPVSTPSPEVQEYLQKVMEVHAGNAALNSGRGLLPYARVPVAGGDQP